VFCRRDKLYTANFAENSHTYLTKAYAKAEESRARQAHELLKLSGYPSLQEAIHLIQDGNIANMPLLTTADMRRAFNVLK
jgi:hypothetical protein